MFVKHPNKVSVKCSKLMHKIYINLHMWMLSTVFYANCICTWWHIRSNAISIPKAMAPTVTWQRRVQQQQYPLISPVFNYKTHRFKEKPAIELRTRSRAHPGELLINKRTHVRYYGNNAVLGDITQLLTNFASRCSDVSSSCSVLFSCKKKPPDSSHTVAYTVSHVDYYIIIDCAG